jgi:hypothetical protein
MTEHGSVVIGHGGALTLSRGSSGPSGDLWSLHICLVADGLVAETNVRVEGADQTLDDFFDELSKRGDVKPTWVSDGGGLTLKCTPDGFGHVGIAVELRSVGRGGWLACADAVLDADQLAVLARRIRELLAPQAT